MNILFLHPNFPGQYVHLAQFFANSGRHRVFFLSKETNGSHLKDVSVALYKPSREGTKGIHNYAHYLEDSVLDGQAIVRGLAALREQAKFVPDVVVGHSGWGSTMYVKDFYPNVPLIAYFEWYYHSTGADVGYWPDEVVSIDAKLRIRTMNAHHLLDLQSCDVRYTPTKWQKSQFPVEYQPSMQVAHEGVDTNFCRPNPNTKLVLPKLKLDLSDAEEIVTYVSRGFEPYRGFPQFMEAMRILLQRRPKCHVVIVGKDRSCYGPGPAKDKTWKQVELEKGGLDMNRVHFTDLLNREDYLKVLQASTVHVYLTRPFVLSWSMLEAMSAGVCLVGSKTPPVQEAVEDGVNGLLANFRQPEHIAYRIEEALDNPELRQRLSKAARESVIEKYELRDCLRRQVNMIYGAMK